jgi:hypothetical protein
MTAADFCAKSMSGIENNGDRLLLVDCDYSPVQSRCRKADIEIVNH